ncbi:MBL fold metallo-hydrolase [Fundicoccus culcitae]|uniref:MBL fold metallo-hydrolase n=1 Tax=Fundicoccus culcitae TaxID=2969821 RepID=A0ABY5P462_9LACT|nr:MBL fold metallo-hydrolase [Fundicoccus culcitae]UUX33228.1 MBL fold metallo-hydrolase [Fundicoccus culcitae]
MLKIEKMVVGIAQENTYAIINEANKALIIDPGANPEGLISWIRSNQWEPQAVLLTHCHYDHIGALDAIRDAFGIDAYVHPIEADFITDARQNLSYYGGSPFVQRPAEHEWHAMETKVVGDFTFDVAFVPGHSPGHVVYLFKEHGFVICGDTVFANSIGRTDLPGGNHPLLITGIQNHILPLPGDTLLYPGHGPATTVAQELKTNPYL